MRTSATRFRGPRLPSFVAPVCLGTALVLVPSMARVAGQAAAPTPAADPLLRILADELQRNVEGLKREPVPPYFASYTVYDTDKKRFEFKRVEYDIETAADKVLRAKLERNFAHRLFIGV